MRLPGSDPGRARDRLFFVRPHVPSGADRIPCFHGDRLYLDTSQVDVSQTVDDLVAGTGLTFVDAGEHELKSARWWHLYRLVSLPQVLEHDLPALARRRHGVFVGKLHVVTRASSEDLGTSPAAHLCAVAGDGSARFDFPQLRHFDRNSVTADRASRAGPLHRRRGGGRGGIELGEISIVELDGYRTRVVERVSHVRLLRAPCGSGRPAQATLRIEVLHGIGCHAIPETSKFRFQGQRSRVCIPSAFTSAFTTNTARLDTTFGSLRHGRPLRRVPFHPGTTGGRRPHHSLRHRAEPPTGRREDGRVRLRA